jgi:hypothetical protein
LPFSRRSWFFVYAHSTVIYFKLGGLGSKVLCSENPKIIVHLPIRDEHTPGTKSASTKAAKKSKARKTIVSEGTEWLSAKPKAKKRTIATKAKKPTKAKKQKTAKPKKKTAKKATRSAKSLPIRSEEVIELLSDDDSIEDAPPASLKREGNKNDAEDLWEDDDSSEEEYEFH